MKATKDQIIFLNNLRNSGETNMFGAGAYLEEFFNLKKSDARKILADWMNNFSTYKEIKDEVCDAKSVIRN